MILLRLLSIFWCAWRVIYKLLIKYQVHFLYIYCCVLFCFHLRSFASCCVFHRAGIHSLINMSAFLCRILMCISVIGKSLWSRGNYRIKIFSWINFLVNMPAFLCIIIIGAILSENWWTSGIKCLFLKYKVGGFLLEHWIPAWQNEFIAFSPMY